MAMMLDSVVQPPIMSLFSSTGSDPLGLFRTATDDTLRDDSCVLFLNDASGESESLVPAPPVKSAPQIIAPPSIDSTIAEGSGYALSQTVLHIQSPTLRTTYIQSASDNLGIKHPWIHLQVRDLGRDWSFEVGVVDLSKRRGTIRFSTFQTTPRLHPAEASQSRASLLHLPLAFPKPSPQSLTAWSTISIHLPPLVPCFSDLSLLESEEEEDVEDMESSIRTTIGAAPSGTFSCVSYVKVYATCRLRRIWFNEAGPSQALPWEFELYS